MRLSNRVKVVSIEIAILVLILLFSTFVVSGVRSLQSELFFSSISREKPLYRVGEERTFTAYNFSRDQTQKVKAVCRRVGKYYYIFTQKGLNISEETLRMLGESFDGEIYPGYDGDILNRDIAPGVNADHRVTILLLDERAAVPKRMRNKIVRGFFWQVNELSRLFEPRSNQSKIIYVFTNPHEDAVELIGTLEHEVAHLKNWTTVKSNVGIIFIATFSLITLCTIYVGLSYLYSNFMEAKNLT